MARLEQDREDLLAEARALVARVEVRVAGFGGPVVAGFRTNGCASFYFGPDEAYHFSSRGELRRAYLQGCLIKAEKRGLVALSRHREPRAVRLERTGLADAEVEDLLGRLQHCLDHLYRAITEGRTDLVGEVPSGSGVLSRVLEWIAALNPPIRVATSPHAR